MYHEDLIFPAQFDPESFWQTIVENLEYARHVLEDYPVESRSDALSGKYRSADEGGKFWLPGLTVIAYRRGTDEMNQRDFFYGIGRKVLPIVTELVESRNLTPEFTHYWGVLQCCHGYIASYLFDDGDNFTQNQGARQRAEATSVEAQRIWVARALRREISAGRSRKEAERTVAELAQAFIDVGGYGEAFPAAWFAAVLKGNVLKSTYGKSQISGAKLSELADRGGFALPPVDAP